MQQCKTKTTLENPNSKLLLMSSPPKNIDLISCGSMIHVSDIKLKRTDTTLDLSQKAEKAFQVIYPYVTKNYVLYFVTNYFLQLEIGRGCAHASPTATNYDIGSPSWGDLKAAPLPSAMVVTTLGHEFS
ncbi:hypothetical protein E1A91_D10G080700v1 [Gossypium mustelinum]|uniref:Uncharacterized protein n=1 Tax=Gossypium mustelinum TaxID=34275 RepID=A0A5D2T622_GOSMU|nr:hypothetical protein E1A91_D10G080700v1 [Gossypium mustelinum]